MAEGSDHGQSLGKCEFSTRSAFDTRAWTKHLIVHATCMVCIMKSISINTSSRTHFTGPLKWAHFSPELAFAWGEAGTKNSWAWYNWKGLSWRQSTLQAWDVGMVASKFWTSHMESSHWCPSFDGRASNCFKNTNKVLQFLHYHWYVSICFKWTSRLVPNIIVTVDSSL